MSANMVQILSDVHHEDVYQCGRSAGRRCEPTKIPELLNRELQETYLAIKGVPAKHMCPSTGYDKCQVDPLF